MDQLVADMTAQPIDTPSADHCIAWDQCWNDLIRLPRETSSLREIYANGEKVVQYCRSETKDQGSVWFKEKVEASEAMVAGELATDPENVEWKRLHAAFAGALAGLDGLWSIAGITSSGMLCARLMWTGGLPWAIA